MRGLAGSGGDGARRDPADRVLVVVVAVACSGQRWSLIPLLGSAAQGIDGAKGAVDEVRVTALRDRMQRTIHIG
jgi:hypothetical protein